MNREELQENLAEIAYKEKQGILKVAPRVGKTAIALRTLEKIGSNKVLVIYPDGQIRKSWDDEIERLGYKGHITFSTNMSMWKHLENSWDVIILDEIHRLSERNIAQLVQKCHQNALEAHSWILGLSGSLLPGTEKELLMRLKLPTIASFDQEEAIKAGFVTDYEIRVMEVPLDNTIPRKFGKKTRTEKKQFDAISFIINKLQFEGKDTKFLALGRMRVVQSSIAKLNATKSLLRKLKGQRVLVFCGLIKIAEQLGIPVHHSGEDTLSEFIEGATEHQAVVKIGGAGITYKPLSTVIINYFSSNGEELQQRINRAMNLEFDNPEKLAIIYIICSTESVEKRWLSRALEAFEKEKIKYVII